MIELLKFVLSDIGIFFGFLIILAALSNFIAKMYALTLRYFTIRRNGYPPEHCDADGDFTS
jgi:hypothetical protein